MSLSWEQANRKAYLQQMEQEREEKKQEVKKQSEESGEQYKPPKETPDFREILGNWWQSIEKEQKHLSELYTKMYQIAKNRPDLLKNVSGLYRTVWYDTMSNQEKKIVDYFLWGRPKYKVDDDSLNL